MGKFRRLDQSAGRVNRQVRAIRRDMREQRAAKRLPGTQVSEGGSFFVRGVLAIVGLLDLTGTVSMKSEDGFEIVRLGDMTYGRGFTLSREGGTAALSFRKPFDFSAQQTWSLNDQDGFPIVEENAFGQGLGRPYLEMPLQPVATTPGTAVTCGPYGWERRTTSATLETLFAYDGKAQNPFIDFKFAAICSDATTAGEVQIVNLITGLPLNGFLSAAPWVGSIPAGSTSLTILDPTPDQVALPFDTGVGGQVRIGVQCRRTAGTGTITLSVAQSIGG